MAHRPGRAVQRLRGPDGALVALRSTDSRPRPRPAVVRLRYTLEMYKPAAKRRWGYYALPILHEDRLVGKLDAAADRDASVLRVNAIHEDVAFTRTMKAAVRAEIENLAAWLGLAAVEPA